MKNSKKLKSFLILCLAIILLRIPLLLTGSTTTLKVQTRINLINNSNLSPAITPLWNHSLGDDQWVTALAISSDSDYIAATYHTLNAGFAENGTIILFNNSLPKIKYPIWKYSIINSFYSVAISANGSYIVAGGSSYDNTIHFFDYLNPIPIWNYSTGGRIYDVWISNDGHFIGAASGSKRIFLFNQTSHSPYWEASISGLALRVEASSNASYIAVTDNAHKLHLFNKSSSLPEWTYSFPSDMATALSMSANGDYIVTGSEGVFLFNKNSSIPIWVYNTSQYIRSVKITPDGNYIVAGGWDNKVYLFNRSDSTPIWSYQTDGRLGAVDISDNGEYIVAQSSDDYVYLFTKASSTPIWSYKLDGVQTGSYDYRLDISPDGKYIVAGGIHHIYLFENEFATSWITINSPKDDEIFGNSAPDYNITIYHSYNSIWYTIDNGLTNFTTESLNGTIDQAYWDTLSDGPLELTFYVNNSKKHTSSKFVSIIKDTSTSSIPSGQAISGYNLPWLAVAISIIFVVLIKKKKQK